MILEQAKDVLRIEAESITNLIDKVDDNFIRMVELICNTNGRVIFAGIGKSGLIGRKIAATLNSTGTNAFFLHPVEAMHGDLGMVTGEDVLIAMSNSGETEELNHMLPSIRGLGCKMIAFTGNPESTLGKSSDIIINVGVEKEACPLGLAPTSSTTALLAMGDALAVVLINQKRFRSSDFKKYHPGGALGQRLSSSVDELMVTGDAIPVVTETTGLGTAIKEIDQKRLGITFISGKTEILTGVLTDGDIRHLVAAGKLNTDTPVSEVMIQNPKKIKSGSPLYDALNIMETYQITVLPVVSAGDAITGAIHLHDILGKGQFKFS